MHDRLGGEEVRAIRAAMNVSEVDFALMLGVTMRTVQLWEAEVVVPSRLTSMVIRAEAAKRLQQARAAAAGAGHSLGLRRSRVARPTKARAPKPSRTLRVR